MYKQVKKFNTLTIGFLYNCLKYVRTGFKIDKTVPTAWQSWQQNTTKHKDLNHPKNVDVPIYFSGAGGYGHVVTWVARKKRYYSSPYRRFSFRATFKTLLEIERIYKCKVVGWAESVNGVRVIAKVPVKKPVKKPTGTYYIVKRGDNLTEIAKKHKLSLAKIAKLNPQIKNINKINIGQRVRIK